MLQHFHGTLAHVNNVSICQWYWSIIRLSRSTINIWGLSSGYSMVCWGKIITINGAPKLLEPCWSHGKDVTILPWQSSTCPTCHFAAEVLCNSGVFWFWLSSYICAPLFWVFKGGLPFVIPRSYLRLVRCMERIWQQSYDILAPANHVIMQYHRGAPQLTAIFALKPNLRPLFWMFWGGLRSWGRSIAFCKGFLTLYMVPKGNSNERLVHGRTTLQVSHHNGSTTPPVAT